MRLAALALVLASACHSVGPGTVARDRIDYGASITDSWKRQTLLNVVKLRYADAPLFLDVGQIVAGYTFEVGASAGANLETGSNSVALGASGTFTDRPTVTYVPLTGPDFLRSLMTPLPPATIFSSIEAGWPADLVMGIAVETLNGLRNERATLGGATPADEAFVRTLDLLTQVQRAGGLSIRVRKTDGVQDTLLTFRGATATDETRAAADEIRRLLGLDPEVHEFNLAFGQVQANPREVAVATRSLLQMMLALAGGVQVPEADVKDGRASSTWAEIRPGAFQVRSGKGRPKDPFVAVEYRGRWFWIDDTDFATKRRFALLMLLFSLADTTSREGQPVLTIPT